MKRRPVRKAEALNGQKYIYEKNKQTNKHTNKLKQIKKQIKKQTTKIG